MNTIYRKYRPQSWEELVGQEHIKLTLEKELESNKMAHAYLFSGPRGSGKTTTARLLAKSLNCEKRIAGASLPCNECGSCKEIAEGHSIDVIEIDAASNTGVDNVRENIIDTARLLPTKSKYKVFIIDEVHMLSTSAFNALLKILEEPPAHVFFILATTEPYKIPATILSRCQRFDFKKVEINKIVERLQYILDKEGINVDKKILSRIAHRSEGCLRDAEGLLGQLLALGEKNITEEEASLVLPRSDFHQITEFLDLLIDKNLQASMLYLNNLVEEGIDLINFTENLIAASRLLMLAKINSEISLLSLELEEDQLKHFKSLSQKINLSQLQQLLELLLKQKNKLKYSPIPQLPLELVILEICEQKTSPVVESVVGQKDYKAAPPSSPVPQKKEKDVSTEIKKIVITNTETETKSTEEETSPILPEIQEIKEKWQLFISKVQNFNHSLPFILKMGEPLEIKNRVLRIGFRFGLHRDKFNETKIKILAEKVFDEIFPGSKLRLEGTFQEEAANLDKVEENEDNSVVTSLVEDFGGQVLN